MSLFGAMNTAISGLSAQSAAFGNISDNVANGQTVGFKRVDTSFSDYLTTSTAQMNESGTVVARPDYVNTVQGTIAQTDNSLGMAITGQGFFVVSQPTGTDGAGHTEFASQDYYTRAGDFQLNKSGNLVNGDGDYLNGWIADPTTGVLDKSVTKPIQVAQSVYKPVATQDVTMAANLPSDLITKYVPGSPAVAADPTATPPVAGSPATAATMTDASGNAVAQIQPQVSVYDATGGDHTIQYTWTPAYDATTNAVATPPASWTLSATLQGTPSTDLGSVQVQFNNDGTLKSVGSATAGGTGTPQASASTTTGDPATVVFDTGLATATAGSTQKITLDLGSIGRTDGVTQFSAADFTLRGLSQDGVPPGSFSSISTQASGDIYANYDNGQTRLIARVPLATFGNADALQRQDGSSFTVTRDSGDPSVQDSSTNGAGALVTSAVESSNVDIASEFSNLIVAQRAYSANAKVVTAADQLLQTTIDMER